MLVAIYSMLVTYAKVMLVSNFYYVSYIRCGHVNYIVMGMCKCRFGMLVAII